MSSQPILYGIGGLLIGMLLTGLMSSYAVNHNNTAMMGAIGMHTSANTLSSNDMMGSSADPSMMSMGEMSNDLAGLSGDAFDKQFLTEMIAHHQGAINMANLAKAQAKHQEVKDMAGSIIAAQTSEIDQMHGWQVQWGY